MLSWKNNRDCFGNSGASTDDHIFPKAEGGTNKIINIQKLTQASNVAKGNKLSGKINGIEFRVLKMTSKSQEVYGRMSIKVNGEFIPVTPA